MQGQTKFYHLLCQLIVFGFATFLVNKLNLNAGGVLFDDIVLQGAATVIFAAPFMFIFSWLMSQKGIY